MAILASSWFHFCSASGWVRAELTGLSAKAARSRGSSGQLEVKQSRGDLCVHATPVRSRGHLMLPKSQLRPADGINPGNIRSQPREFCRL